MKRNDIHRPSSIIPGDYAYLFSYIVPGSDPFERWNTDVALDAFRRVRDEGKKIFGGLGRCGVCGARYRYGDVWEHVPTGDLVNFGHDCAAKYEFLADRSDFEAALASYESRRKALAESTRRARQFAGWCAVNPAVAGAFDGVTEDAQDKEAAILRDLAAKCRQWGSLSEKQVAFALSLGRRRMGPALPPKPEEAKVAAPVGEKRVVIRGTLVSKKAHDSAYGTSIKGTIKVHTPDGVWLAWGTLPDSILLDYDAKGNTVRAEVGDVIELSASLVAGREPSFAFFKRPTKASIVTKANRREGVAA